MARMRHRRGGGCIGARALLGALLGMGMWSGPAAAQAPSWAEAARAADQQDWGVIEEIAPLTEELSATGYTASTSATECMGCHIYEYVQWDEGQTGHLFPTEVYTGGERTGAMHRLALLDETFHTHYVENREPDSCLRCHVPTTVYDVARTRAVYAPTSRSADAPNAEEGITCVSCHLDTEGNIRGEHAYTTSQADHAVVADTRMFRDGFSLCQSCHGDPFYGALSSTYAQWDAQARSSGLTCVDCHMVSLDDFTTPSHAFPGAHSETMVGQGYVAHWPQTLGAGEDFVLEVCNQFAGHNLPTGDQFRAYVFKVTVTGAAGGFSEERRISPLFRTPVMVEGDEDGRYDPIPFLSCRDLEFPALRAGTYTVSYEVGFWLLKPAKVKVLIPLVPDKESDGEVYRQLDSDTYTLRIED